MDQVIVLWLPLALWLACVVLLVQLVSYKLKLIEEHAKLVKVRERITCEVESDLRKLTDLFVVREAGMMRLHKIHGDLVDSKYKALKEMQEKLTKQLASVEQMQRHLERVIDEQQQDAINNQRR